MKNGNIPNSDCSTVNHDISANSHEFVTDKNVYAVNYDLFIPAHTRAEINVLVLDHNNWTTKIAITSQNLNRIYFF